MTAEEFLTTAIAKKGLCELVRGQVRESKYETALHGMVCANVACQLSNWSRRCRNGITIGNNPGIITERNPDTVRGPDLLWYRPLREPGLNEMDGWLETPPVLCVEVLSPSDQWGDVLRKVAEYLKSGVEEVWILVLSGHRLHRYFQEAAPQVLEIDDTLTSSCLPGFSAPVGEFFAGC
ncbi:MAG: Uma2 family endonuclease [Planctomycetaceae bacterium]